MPSQNPHPGINPAALLRDEDLGQPNGLPDFVRLGLCEHGACMPPTIFGSLLILWCSLAPATIADGEVASMEAQPSPPTVTILYDNRSTAEGLETAWGFACLVEGLEKTILFDTGGDSPTLLGNMKSLGIDPQRVDLIAISHAHYDHAGGLAGLLEIHPAVTVYLLESFPDEIAREARALGAEVVEISGPVELCPGASLGGELVGRGGIPEQSLLLSMENGITVITGCAHPGIVQTVELARETTSRDVRIVIGGFHLFRDSDAAIAQVISRLQALGVRWAAPCHCSGDAAIERFAESYGEGFLHCGTGAVFPVARLLGGSASAADSVGTEPETPE